MMKNLKPAIEALNETKCNLTTYTQPNVSLIWALNEATKKTTSNNCKHTSIASRNSTTNTRIHKYTSSGESYLARHSVFFTKSKEVI